MGQLATRGLVADFISLLPTVDLSPSSLLCLLIPSPHICSVYIPPPAPSYSYLPLEPASFPIAIPTRRSATCPITTVLYIYDPTSAQHAIVVLRSQSGLVMRFSTPSLVGLYGLLSTSAFTLVRGESSTTFMNVRENMAKDYKNEDSIPSAKYFSKCSIV